MGQPSSNEDKGIKIIVCGLDNSGKSTTLNMLKSERDRESHLSATIGYSVERFRIGGTKIECTAFDMGGAKKFRDLWATYFGSIDGIVFVIDSADPLRLCIVKDELDAILEHADVSSRPSIPLLVFANKMDLKAAKTPSQLIQMLELHDPVKLKNRPFNIFASNALVGTGLQQGMKWLAECVAEARKK